MREIEIKLRVKNLEELEEKLKQSGLTISKEIKQHDTIYVDKPNMFNNFKEGELMGPFTFS